jgi:AcrR family transcriptional regulator
MANSSRRARVRADTLAEIVDHGLRQVATGGPAALSLNAIAREIGLSGPAIYRYFSGRDELLAELVRVSYQELSAALHEAAAAANRRQPPARFRAVAAAYRSWALANPRRYRVLFADPVDVNAAPIPAPQQAIAVFVEVLRELPGRPVPAAMRTPLVQWAGASPALPGSLDLVVRAWTRLHGVVSLELGGALSGLDAGLLIEAELDALLG